MWDKFFYTVSGGCQEHAAKVVMEANTVFRPKDMQGMEQYGTCTEKISLAWHHGQHKHCELNSCVLLCCSIFYVLGFVM